MTLQNCLEQRMYVRISVLYDTYCAENVSLCTRRPAAFQETCACERRFRAVFQVKSRSGMCSEMNEP